MSADAIISAPFEDRADFTIPEKAIDRWTDIHPEAPVLLSLSREDLDRFFFMHVQIGGSIAQLQQAVIELSNGRIPEAQTAMEESQRLNTVQLGNIRAFMTAIMERATAIGSSSNER